MTPFDRGAETMREAEFIVAQLRRLRKRGMLWSDISAITGLSVAECIRVWEEPEWPKLVTRIGEDGTAEMVRTQ